jgi:hypothetical protein
MLCNTTLSDFFAVNTDKIIKVFFGVFQKKKTFKNV